MTVVQDIGMIIFLSIYILSSANAEEEVYCALPLASIEVDKEAHIGLVTKRYASQTKGLIPYFDGSELLEQIPNSDLAVVMLPYGTNSNENDNVLSLVLAVVDLREKSILQSYFHKDIAESDAIYISDIILDTKTFKDISKHVSFAVTMQFRGSSRPNPYGSSILYMYGIQDGKLSLILDAFEVMESGGENNTVGTGYEISKTLTYKTHKPDNEYDSLIFDSLSKRVDYDYSDNKSEEITSEVLRKEVRLKYSNGRYQEAKTQTCLNEKTDDIDIRAFIKEIIVDIEKSKINSLVTKFQYPLSALVFEFKNKEEFVSQWQKDSMLKSFMELRVYDENDQYSGTVRPKDSSELQVFYAKCKTVRFAITPGMIFEVVKIANRYKIVSWTSVY